MTCDHHFHCAVCYQTTCVCRIPPTTFYCCLCGHLEDL